MAEVERVGSEFLVNTETAGLQYNSTITGLADGGFVVTWMDVSGTLGDSDGSSIKAQVFDASGAKQGSEFLAARAMTCSMARPGPMRWKAARAMIRTASTTAVMG